MPVIRQFIFCCSRFVYPAVVVFIIATIAFPKGLGQFMAGEVSVLYFILNKQ